MAAATVVEDIVMTTPPLTSTTTTADTVSVKDAKNSMLAQFEARSERPGSLGQFLCQMLQKHAQDPSVFSHQPFLTPLVETDTFVMANYIANNGKFARIRDTDEYAYIFSAFFPFSYGISLDKDECVRFELEPNTRFHQPATGSTEAVNIPVSYMLMDRYSAAFLDQCKHALILLRSDTDATLINDIYVTIEDTPVDDEQSRAARTKLWEDAIVAVDACFAEWASDRNEAIKQVRQDVAIMKQKMFAKEEKK